MQEIKLKDIDFDKIESILSEKAKTRQPTKSFDRIVKVLYALKKIDIDELAEQISVEYDYTRCEITIKTYAFSVCVVDIFYLSKALELSDTFSIDLMDDDTMNISFGFNYVFTVDSDVLKDIQVEYTDNGKIKTETTKAISNTQAIRQVQRKNCSSINQDNFKVK